MNKKFLPLFAFAIILSCATLSVYAGKELCPASSVHCSYVTGLSEDVNDGRYIKLTNSKINIVLCFNNYSLAFLDQQGAAKHVGSNADQYSICTDVSGTHCEPIGLDSFVISQMNNRYVADPKYFDIDLSNVKNNYPTCSSSKSFVKLS